MTPTTWLHPEPLPRTDTTLPHMSSDLLPEPIRAFVVSTAQHVSLPVEAVASTAIAAISGVLGRTFVLTPKGPNDFWQVTPNLWSLVVAPSGSRKSALLKIICQDIEEINQSLHEEFLRRKEIASTELAYIDDQIQLIKKGNLSDTNKIKQLRIDKEKYKPKKSTLLVTHPTTMRLAEIMSENPRGILQRADEASDIFNQLLRTGNEMGMNLYLTSWNGDESFNFEKMNGRDIYIFNACLSFVGATQPSALSDLMENKAFMSRGLIQRLQLLILCKMTEEICETNSIIGKDSYRKIITSLNRVYDINEKNTKSVSFDFSAQILWDKWYDEYNRKIRHADLQSNEPYLAHFSKYASLVPSLALIFSAIHFVSQDRHDWKSFMVSGEAIEKSIAWCEYLDLHARQIYKFKSKNEILSDATLALASRIQSGQITDKMTVRSVIRKGWVHLKNESDVDEAVDDLQNLNWLYMEHNLQKRSRILRLNPALIQL